MQLRHIRPRSVEWYDALIDDQLEDRKEPLNAEMRLRLRTLLAVEQLEVQAPQQK
jgi:hypothetical protein